MIRKAVIGSNEDMKKQVQRVSECKICNAPLCGCEAHDAGITHYGCEHIPDAHKTKPTTPQTATEVMADISNERTIKIAKEFIKRELAKELFDKIEELLKDEEFNVEEVVVKHLTMTDLSAATDALGRHNRNELRHELRLQLQKLKEEYV